ncbi:MAG: hypothetical protein PHE80_01115 [Candidatus Omnitrophica bacterium]|nr:hypothetical protein [Candidatus Omnitrophota bacterium]MDD5736742.1 hypothetical protein [Candidatus Omnitrophota bacterium]
MERLINVWVAIRSTLDSMHYVIFWGGLTILLVIVLIEAVRGIYKRIENLELKQKHEKR